MSAELATIGSAVEQVLIGGDLGKLTADQRVSYYKAVCDSVGLNPLTRPFDYITLNGKLTLYAKRDATDQLRRIHGVSVRITSRETIDGVYVVSASATDKTGRTDESTGAVTITNLKADALANAFMKAETKAKRRVTLSICGLGLLDETEVETIPGARTHVEQPEPAKLPANGSNGVNHTDEEVFLALRTLGQIEKKPTASLIMELFAAMKMEASSLDELNQRQLNRAYAAVEERIARHKAEAAKEPTDLEALAK